MLQKKTQLKTEAKMKLLYRISCVLKCFNQCTLIYMVNLLPHILSAVVYNCSVNYRCNEVKSYYCVPPPSLQFLQSGLIHC